MKECFIRMYYSIIEMHEIVSDNAEKIIICTFHFLCRYHKLDIDDIESCMGFGRFLCHCYRGNIFHNILFAFLSWEPHWKSVLNGKNLLSRKENGSFLSRPLSRGKIVDIVASPASTLNILQLFFKGKLLLENVGSTAFPK